MKFQFGFFKRIAVSLKNNKRLMNVAAIVSSAVFVALAILTLIASRGEALVPVSKVAVIVAGISMFLISAEILLFAFVFGEEVPNFFCYDAARGKNLPVSALTPELIGRRMDAYTMRIAKNKGQLWLPGYLEKCDFGGKEAFRPAVAYKMLLDLAAVDSENGWKCFTAAVPATVKWITDTLAPYEPQMMKDVWFIKMKFSNDPEKIRDCLVRNRPYLQKRMAAYVTQNIQKFRGVK